MNKSKLMFILLAFFILFLLAAQLAIASGECSSRFDGVKGYILLSMISLMVFFKFSAWILGWVAAKTEATWDNRLARGLAAASHSLGWILGLFGIGHIPGTVDGNPKKQLKKILTAQDDKKNVT